MTATRRNFLQVMPAFGALALLSGGWAAGGQNPGRGDTKPRDQDEDPLRPTALPNATKAILQENQKNIKKDIDKLYQLAGELKAEVEKTDSSQVLSIGLVRKAEEIEKLAKEIKSRAKG